MEWFWQPLFPLFGYSISIMDMIDLSLVGYLLYRLYKLAKGTSAINIFFGLIAIYLVYQIFDIFRMKFITQILGGFISITFIMIVILFQQEIRKYLNQLGKGKIVNKNLSNFFSSEITEKLNIEAIIKSCISFSQNKTGAIIVITQSDDLNQITDSAVKLDANISFSLIESIFYKNSPLHDGAIVIRNNKIISAKCILPITNDEDFPLELGMRHRSAVGISEISDSITIVVSEQSGKISFAYSGNIQRDVSIKELENFIKKEFNSR